MDIIHIQAGIKWSYRQFENATIFAFSWKKGRCNGVNAIFCQSHDEFIKLLASWNVNRIGLKHLEIN